MKKALHIFTFLLIGFAIATSVALAGATNQTPAEYGASLDANASGDINANIHSMYVKDGLDYRLSCKILGTPCTDNVQGAQTFLQNSVVGQVSTTIASLYENPPANTGQFIAYYAEKMNLVPPAYAQGVGFTGLSPFLGLWRVFRNIAYAFLIVIMVFVGFMVMFRMKIDPRTVVSIQSAIPRIIVTLILITFSYAIVGLMIDLMYLVIFLMVTTVATAAGLDNIPELLTRYTSGTTWDLLSSSWTIGRDAIPEISNVFGGAYTNWTLTGALALGSIFTLGNPLLILGTVISGIGAATGNNPIVYVLIALSVLFIFIRILFTLINAYIQIIVSLIFGPLQLMFGAIPNVNAFSSWFKNLLANIAVFPVVMSMMLLAMVLSSIAAATPNLWRPPGLAGSIGGAVGSGMSGIIALGILFMAPSVAGSIKEALKTKPILPVGVGSVLSPLSTPMSTAWNLGYQLSMIKHYLPGDKNKVTGITPPTAGGGGSGQSH